ncbi:hypothetical protein KCP73_03455 [Salmonella enterica subsp. enterica]|nr:hypothetical protein KCP73_03455 [Salmonella enterica subsp. enterica]
MPDGGGSICRPGRRLRHRASRPATTQRAKAVIRRYGCGLANASKS